MSVFHIRVSLNIAVGLHGGAVFHKNTSEPFGTEVLNAFQWLFDNAEEVENAQDYTHKRVYTHKRSYYVEDNTYNRDCGKNRHEPSYHDADDNENYKLDDK